LWKRFDGTWEGERRKEESMWRKSEKEVISAVSRSRLLLSLEFLCRGEKKMKQSSQRRVQSAAEGYRVHSAGAKPWALVPALKPKPNQP
jgi:hypothetical protein